MNAPELVKWVETSFDIDSEQFEPTPQQMQQQQMQQQQQAQGGQQDKPLEALNKSKPTALSMA